MDLNEKMIFEHYIERIYHNEFDEFDIYSFLILIREHVKPPLRDIANCIAHRKRNCGEAHDNTTHMIECENPSYIEGYKGLDFEKVCQQINEYLSANGFNELSKAQLQDCCLCMLCLLQFAEFESNGKFLGCLYPIIQNDKIALINKANATNFEMCYAELKNTYTIKQYKWYEPNNAPITAIRNNGKLALYVDGTIL